MVTTMLTTAACATSSTPASSSSAADIDNATITAICQPPVPMWCTRLSLRNTPIATPAVTSATRRSRWLYVVPSDTTAAMGAKNGIACPSRSAAIHHAMPAATAACATCQPLSRRRTNRARSDRRPGRKARSSSTAGRRSVRSGGCRSTGGMIPA
jgi:hypothetical protein